MFSLLQILSNSLESSNKIENIINKYKLNTLVGSDVLFAIFILYDTLGITVSKYIVSSFFTTLSGSLYSFNSIFLNFLNFLWD